VGNRLKGKIAFVTGGASGIGTATCMKFAEEGVSGIVIADIKEKQLQEISSEIQQKYDVKIIPVNLDVSEESDWLEAVKIVKEEYGRVDILVNNAGITHRVRFVDCKIEDWNRVIAVNQTGTFLGMKHCAPLMRESGTGSIINISSIAGLTGYFASAYTASKWAVRGMTKAAAMEFGEWGIRVNSVHPGFIWSPLTIPAKEMVEKFNEINALNRAGNPDEVVNSILFLASDESSYITGTELAVDAGLTAGGGVRMVAKEVGIY